MNFLVTGASGWIGRCVCKSIVLNGHSVLPTDLVETEGPWSEFQCLDISQPLVAFASGAKVDAVIHCAGYAHRPNETSEEQKKFYAVNRDGTKHVLNWCELKGIDRFLYVSSIAFYDWDARQSEIENRRSKTEYKGLRTKNHQSPRINNGHSSIPTGATEYHPVSLVTHYAKSKYEGEQLVTSSDLDWRVVRLATVFGEGDRANFSRMVNAMKKHIFPIPGKGGARKSVIPVDLAAEMILEFALMNRPSHQLINVGLPTAPSLREIADAYHAVCGLPICPPIPMPLAKGLGRCGDLAAKVLGKFPFTSETLGKLTTSTEVSVERMLECFPDRKFGSFEEYLKECAEWYASGKRDGS